MEMEKGKIIFLNGVSSAGKSTLAKTLQDRLTEPYYVLANDMFTNDIMCPDKFINIDAAKTYYKALTGMYHAVRAFSDIGINTIVDDVLLKEDDRLEQCVELFQDYPLLFVHVTCPVDELRRREKERGDRGIGQSESQLAQLNPQDTYDITVDTYGSTKEECADKIIEMSNYPKKFKAFEILWDNFQSKLD
ncbi:MAG: chloramphenicol phosphotransferase CPT family protein [Oscillospiraceae bacterium]|nr:chloramphenicol phosphotransferase CPT family protein [Oscillospiraceae bacterium]